MRMFTGGKYEKNKQEKEMQDLKALGILKKERQIVTHIDGISLDEAIVELEKLQEENEHLKNMLEAYKKDKV